jgi:uncharacterized protein
VIIRFEWDPAKAARNLRKHGVGFDEASTAFGDALASTFVDAAHSLGEERLVTLGMSSAHRLLAVMHTEIEETEADHTDVRVIHIISARRATRRERTAYEEVP